jgi:hypothetical protein
VRARAASPGEQQAERAARAGKREGKGKKLYFSNLIFQIKFSNVFKYLLKFDSNQSSQKHIVQQHECKTNC